MSLAMRDKSFAAKLKRARLERGWSQERLARALGVSKYTITRWETGKTRPVCSAVLERIRRVLGKKVLDD